MNLAQRYGNHKAGVIIVVLGVLVLSFDALLIRLAHANPWDVVFWRGALMGISLVLFAALNRRIRVFAAFFECGLPAYFTAILQGFGTAMFVLAISSTSVANTVVLIATAPLFAAIASHFFLREQVPLHTWAACLFVVVGVTLVFSGSFQLSDTLGNLFALLAALGLGGNLTILRRHPEMPRIPLVAVSGAMIALIALPLSAPLQLSIESYFVLSVMGMVQMPLALILITSGTRYLTSPEVSLFLLLETLFGPIWVWMVFDETVSFQTLAGGLIIVVTLVVYSWRSLHIANSD